MQATGLYHLYFYSLLSQEHFADKTLTSVPVYRDSWCYFPRRILQEAAHRLETNIICFLFYQNAFSVIIVSEQYTGVNTFFEK